MRRQRWREGGRSEHRIAPHRVGRDRRGLGCQVHDKNASTPCISPHGERLRYPLSSGTPVCTENLILFDYVTESPNVNRDDRAVLLLPDPDRLAVQVAEPT